VIEQERIRTHFSGQPSIRSRQIQAGGSAIPFSLEEDPRAQAGEGEGKAVPLQRRRCRLAKDGSTALRRGLTGGTEGYPRNESRLHILRRSLKR